MKTISLHALKKTAITLNGHNDIITSPYILHSK